MTDQIQNVIIGFLFLSLFIMFILLNKKNMVSPNDPAGGTWMLFVDRIMDTVDIIVSQITSGRWLLTVGAGICLIHFAWTSSEPAKIIDIIKDIVIFYFVVRDASKPDQKNGASNVQSPANPSSVTVVDLNKSM